MPLEAEARFRDLESSIRRLRTVVGALAVAVLATVGFALAFMIEARQGPGDSNGVVRASSFEIEDGNGVVRARLGAALPDAVIAGEVRPRGSSVAGLMLYDATGQERGGYVTEDSIGHVFLTLDGRDGQSALFVADTSGVTALRIWNDENAVDLRVDSDGSRISALREGFVEFQAPPIDDPRSTRACEAYRDARRSLDEAAILSACRQRMTDEACRACLVDPQ